MKLGEKGYSSSGYAASLAGFGDLQHLECSDGYLLKRNIPGTDYFDATGLYPLFQCDKWGNLATDLKMLSKDICSIVMVVDPLENVTHQELGSIFDDLCRPFKQHFLVELSNDLNKVVSRHHRYYAGYGAKRCTVRILHDCEELLDDWLNLYGQLVQRHQIRGIQRFSQDSFRCQLRLEEMVAFIAESDEGILGIQLWICRGKNAYHHLSAYDAFGYRNRVSYTLLWKALQFFKDAGLSWANLGGGAGESAETSGLTAFKKGWASETKPSYLCGKILDHRVYNMLIKTTGNTNSLFFPAYRNGKEASNKINEPNNEQSVTVCQEPPTGRASTAIK